MFFFFFFFQAEDGIRDADVTGVQTCALPISRGLLGLADAPAVGSLAAERGAVQGRAPRLPVRHRPRALRPRAPGAFGSGRHGCPFVTAPQSRPRPRFALRNSTRPD